MECTFRIFRSFANSLLCKNIITRGLGGDTITLIIMYNSEIRLFIVIINIIFTLHILIIIKMILQKKCVQNVVEHTHMSSRYL